MNLVVFDCATLAIAQTMPVPIFHPLLANATCLHMKMGPSVCGFPPISILYHSLVLLAEL